MGRARSSTGSKRPLNNGILSIYRFHDPNGGIPHPPAEPDVFPERRGTMNIVGFTDIHGRTEKLINAESAIREADLVLLSGDITHFGHSEDAGLVIAEIRRLANGSAGIGAVHGNCDYPAVESYLVGEGLSLSGRCLNAGEYALIGAGGSLPAPGSTPNEYSEDELGMLLACGLSGVRAGSRIIMVSHQPPRDTALDRVGRRHVGSRAVRDFILKNRPLLCFCGHIHESMGIDEIGDTVLVNPGPLPGGGYALAQLGDGDLSVKIIQSGAEVARLDKAIRKTGGV